MDNLSPELIEAIGKAAIGIIAAFGAIVTTLVTGFTAYFTYRNRRDLHIAFDRVRELKGEPLQFRHDPDARARMAKAVSKEAEAVPTSVQPPDDELKGSYGP